MTWGLDGRKARSLTDAVDNDPNKADALEVGTGHDREVTRTGPFPRRERAVH